jgi:ABC-type phosphate/phosphonate transport system substrate-binding protein
MRVAVSVLMLLVSSSLSFSIVDAQEAKLEVRNADTVKNVLERQVGKRVGVVLHTGQELTGVVTTVGDKVVHLAELSGRDFFDAVVSLDQVAAVVVRVRGR